MGDLTTNFSRHEFRCPCCPVDSQFTKMEMVQVLQKIRTAFGRALTVTSGVRCYANNKAVGGALESRHLPHHADGVDIACTDSISRYRLIELALRHGVKGIKVYEKHLHFDMRPGPQIFFTS